MSWYGGNETGAIPGAFPEKWWEGAALFHSALQYWYTTGDTTYNDIVKKGMQHQAGKHGNYLPSNYSSFLVSAIDRLGRLLQVNTLAGLRRSGVLGSCVHERG